MTARRSPALSLVFHQWQFLILAALTLWLYWHTLVRLFVQWGNDQNFSHGYFVPLFSGFVIWQERDRLARIKLRPSWSGLLLVSLGLVVLVLGQMGVELFLMRSSLLVLAAGLVVLFAGWTFFRAVFFPWAFLFLMIPIPAIIYGYLMEKRLVIRYVLALASVPIAVAANSFRIITTGLMVQYWDPDKAEGYFHTSWGWIVFVLSLLMLYGLHTSIRWIWPERANP
jgi:exosortase/archaeosortase family protein